MRLRQRLLEHAQNLVKVRHGEHCAEREHRTRDVCAQQRSARERTVRDRDNLTARCSRYCVVQSKQRQQQFLAYRPALDSTAAASDPRARPLVARRHEQPTVD